MLVLVVLGVVLGVASVGGACDRLVGSSGGSHGRGWSSVLFPWSSAF